MKIDIKVIYFLIGTLILFPSSVIAGKIRVHCQERGYVFERVPDDADLTLYQPMEHEQIVVIDEGELPHYKYPEQLKCQDGRLLFDPTFKPPYAITQEARRERLKQLRAQLDEELAKENPDAITVARAQRTIERVKRGEE